MHRKFLSPPMMLPLLAILAIALVVGLPLARAKRSAPPVVPEIATPKAVYSAPNEFFHPKSSSSGITTHTTGLVEARQPGTGELLWQQTAYTVHYIEGMETDVQDVWVLHLALDEGRGLLLVTDERHRIYALDLATLGVTRATTGSGDPSVSHRGTSLRIRMDPESSTPVAIIDAATGERTQLLLGTAPTKPIESAPSVASSPAASSSSSPLWMSIALVFSMLGALSFVFERRRHRLGRNRTKYSARVAAR